MIPKLALGLVIWTAASALAFGQEENDKAPALVREPSAIEITSVYPKLAYAQGLDGQATIDCLVKSDGIPEHCSVLSEDPKAQGFGKAASALLPYMKFNPGTTAGHPASGHVQVTLNFTTPGADKWPDYIRTPTKQEFQTVWPSGIKRDIKIGCRVEADGSLDACELLQPVQHDAALEAAALRIMTYFRFSPALRDGHAIPANVIVPLRGR